MDFFARQEQALASSRKLILLFLIAWPCVIAAVYVVSVLVYFAGWAFIAFWGSVFAEAQIGGMGGADYFISLWQPTLLLWVALITLAVIACGSTFKVRQLAPGGRVVAALLGGKRLDPATKDLDDLRLLHVVEEMSVASGTPMPDLYVLRRELGLNAFVAGHTVSDMAVCVTEGCVKFLTRDELQGVIAHEYSHILHGDMRLNMRLIGWVHGLFCLTLVSCWVMRKTYSERERDILGQPEPRGGLSIFADLFVLVFGFLLAFIGWNGAFFGRMIKGAVSRQREFLADAAAVQFTRFPEGLANALKKANTWPEGTAIHSPRAEEGSHIYFCDGLDEERVWLTSTHPPLPERISRVEVMMGRSLVPEPAKVREPAPTLPRVQQKEPRVAEAVVQAPTPKAKPFEPATPAPIPTAFEAKTALAEVGLPTIQHLAYAAKLLEGLPLAIRQAVHEPAGANALICSLLLSDDEKVRNAQRLQLKEQMDGELFRRLESLAPVVSPLNDFARLPLVELSFPALRKMSVGEYEGFTRNIRALVAADQQVDLFEFALQKMLRRHLEPAFKVVPRPEVRYYALGGLSYACSTLLSATAHAGQDTPEQAQAAFERGVNRLNTAGVDFRFMPLADCTLNAIDVSLNSLAEAAPRLKKLFLEACVETVAADGVIRRREAEMLRAIADALDCPIPPFVAEAKV